MGDLTGLNFTNSNVTPALETVTVLAGSRSMKLGPGSAGAWGTTWTRPTSEDRGYTAGKIFAIVRIGNQTNADVGFFCMATTEALTGSTGSAIFFGLVNGGNEVLWDSTTGFSGLGLTTPPIVANVGAGLPAVNTTYFTELQWAYDADVFEGLYILYRRGTTLGSMARRLTYFFPTPTVTVPVTEGMYAQARTNGTATNSFAIVDDFTVSRHEVATFIWGRFEKFKPAISTAFIHLVPENSSGGSIEGLYSLEITGGTGGTDTPGALWMSKTTTPVALTSGRVRMRVNVSSPDGHAGIVINCSQRDMLAGGTCYTVGPNYSGGATTRNVALRKCTSTLGTATTLHSSGAMPALGTAYWIEVRWQLSSGNVRFDIYTDTTTDYTAPALLASVTDSSSAYTASAGLGFYCFSVGGTNNMRIRFDQITIDNFGGF